jgi:transcriptional regulator with XRE-family HTH domain
MTPVLCVARRHRGDKEVSKASDFATRLRERRVKVGLSQYALAKRAGVSKQTISHLESGRNEPGWETVQKLALALGVTCEAFTDPKLALPQPKEQPPKKLGRPRKGKG